jgi:hypothetical protein
VIVAPPVALGGPKVTEHCAVERVQVVDGVIEPPEVPVTVQAIVPSGVLGFGSGVSVTVAVQVASP